MITLSDDALALIDEKQSPIFIDIHFGEPARPADYTKQTLRNATVYVPKRFPQEGSHLIRIRKFFGFRRLVLSGWRLI